MIAYGFATSPPSSAKRACDSPVFAHKVRVEIEENGARRPCPLDWMDHFFMRHFTGLSLLEETLPVSEGLLEAGNRVGLPAIEEKFQEWLRGRKLIAAQATVRVSEIHAPSPQHQSSS